MFLRILPITVMFEGVVLNLIPRDPFPHAEFPMMLSKLAVPLTFNPITRLESN